MGSLWLIGNFGNMSEQPAQLLEGADHGAAPVAPMACMAPVARTAPVATRRGATPPGLQHAPTRPPTHACCVQRLRLRAGGPMAGDPSLTTDASSVRPQRVSNTPYDYIITMGMSAARH